METISYPLVEIISILPDRWRREWMISSVVSEPMKDFCAYLNSIADDNEKYEIRSEMVELW